MFCDWITALNQISGKHSMKYRLPIETVLNQVHEIGSGLRRGGMIDRNGKTADLARFLAPPMYVKDRHRFCQTRSKRHKQR
jgi:hypothetical protein